MSDKFLTTEEIAAELGVHIETVRRWIRRGDLPVTRLLKFYRIRREDYEDFLKKREIKKP